MLQLLAQAQRLVNLLDRRTIVVRWSASARETARTCSRETTGTSRETTRTSATGHATFTTSAIHLDPSWKLALILRVKRVWGYKHDGIGNTFKGLLLPFIFFHCGSLIIIEPCDSLVNLGL